MFRLFQMKFPFLEGVSTSSFIHQRLNKCRLHLASSFQRRHREEKPSVTKDFRLATLYYTCGPASRLRLKLKYYSCYVSSGASLSLRLQLHARRRLTRQKSYMPQHEVQNYSKSEVRQAMLLATPAEERTSPGVPRHTTPGPSMRPDGLAPSTVT